MTNHLKKARDALNFLRHHTAVSSHHTELIDRVRDHLYAIEDAPPPSVIKDIFLEGVNCGRYPQEEDPEAAEALWNVSDAKKLADNTPQPFSMPDGRPIFGEGSPHEIGEHIERICADDGSTDRVTSLKEISHILCAKFINQCNARPEDYLEIIKTVLDAAGVKYVSDQ